MQKIAKEFKLEDIIEILLRRRWWLIITFCLSMIVGICLALMLPKMYRTDTLILIEPQKVPRNYVRPVVTTDIDSRLDALSRQIKSRSNLEKIMNDFNLFLGPEYKTMYMEDKIAELRKRISVRLLRRELPGRTGAYGPAYAISISFKGENPEKVMKVTNALASRFIDENIRYRESEAIGTSKFLEEELNSIRKELAEKEMKQKEYREKYMGGLPGQLRSNLSMVTRFQQQLEAKETRLMEEKYKLEILKNQISEGAELFGQGAMLAKDGRIVFDSVKTLSPQQAKAILAYLETRYTQKHPDVIRVKKIISELKEKSGKNNNDISDETQSIPADSKIKIERVEENIKSYTADIAKLKSQIRVFEERIENTPEREQELASLRRDYENIRATYDLLLNKQLETEVALNMEKKQKGEKFQIIDSAGLPSRPSSPNMKMLFLFTLAAAVNIGLGLVLLLEYLDTSFRSPKDIESYLGFSVLATVPLISDQKHNRRKKADQIFSVVSIMLSFILLSAFAVLSFVGVDQTMELLNQFITT